MRVPFSQVAEMATYIAKNKMRPRPEWQQNLAASDAANPFKIVHTQIPAVRSERKPHPMINKRFPLVMMLEPLHACNLTCTGCGRIREYESSIRERLSLEQCLKAVDECDAPMVSICGGEPMLYPEIAKLVEEILARGKYIQLCTNGMFLVKKLKEFKPHPGLVFNVHLDGMEKNHDLAVERDGVFREAIEGVKAAKQNGFKVFSNTTVYKETDMNEIGVLWAFLSELGVGGFMVSPAYAYEAVNTTNPAGADRLFMTRDDVHAKFRAAKPMLKRFRLVATPLYLDFLCGERHLDCAAWANPTRNVGGWRGPCYLLGDAHYKTYAELVAATDWSKYGPGNDRRCEHCLMHCGFEPSAVMESNRRFGDMVKMAMWQMT
jgi:hopanoid biosynthesis associated radical SAM protein HpnH